ncbi:MAG: rhodanese-like domain-containing protein [Anaerolineales bacterium]|jgi:rhodanese-related sulfurtransferase|nr:rhodanese-like domain-containing protein [Anaerolineales bacterium]
MPKKIRRTPTAKKRQINQEKKKLQIGLIVLAVAAVLLSAIFLANPGGQANQSGLPTTVSTMRGYELYQQQDVFVLDVRNQDEWDEFHIPDTTLIPLKELAGRVNEVPKDAKILVVCNSGNRSDEGRDILKKAGYSDVTSMDGGVSNWRELGYPVVP